MIVLTKRLSGNMYLVHLFHCIIWKHWRNNPLTNYIPKIGLRRPHLHIEQFVKTILSGIKVFRFKLTNTDQYCIHIFPFFLDPLTCHLHHFGVLFKLICNKWLVLCLAVVNPSETILKPFYLNPSKVYAILNGPTGQIIFHIQHICIPVHDTKIIDWIKPFFVGQTCTSNRYRNTARLQTNMVFLYRCCCCNILNVEGIGDQQVWICDRVFSFTFTILAIRNLVEQPPYSSVVTSTQLLPTNVGWLGPGQFPKEKVLRICSWKMDDPARQNKENCLTSFKWKFYFMPATIFFFSFFFFLFSVPYDNADSYVGTVILLSFFTINHSKV